MAMGGTWVGGEIVWVVLKAATFATQDNLGLSDAAADVEDGIAASTNSWRSRGLGQVIGPRGDVGTRIFPSA